MSKVVWTPWHKVVKLRDDLRSGELPLAVFAADLYDVMMGTARAVYQDPREFFSLTYPTFNLRELTKDVVLRLAGRNDKAVRQLELTYGGGKTHALIALFHLVTNPDSLPDLPAVQEFIQHIGTAPPRARAVVLPFDKLDVEKGMEVRRPDGVTRWLKHPWSAMAYQIAGVEGLKLLHADGLDAERESCPAENLMAELLAYPGKQGLSTLVLIDEVLMYAREKIGLDPTWRGRLANFFQYLTQAATKVDRCAVVASLLATDPRKSDTLGKEIAQELYAIFRREREEGVEPVVKEDVAEVLRRRFFAPESIRNREAFRPHVVAALQGIADLDEQTRKEGSAAEERFLRSYPFHPDLTDVFYSKWTNLEGFQRTRGVLRTFALALRQAEQWDDSPLISANVFLGEPGKGGVCEAARELTSIAASEEYEGKKQEWTGILEGELAKARRIQEEMTGLRFRELEQAVFATFLHSQPIGQKALTRELLLLLGHTRPDRIELEKALCEWAEVSWFLDEGVLSDAEIGEDRPRSVPKSWRLGSKPNLKQMHHDACVRVPVEFVKSRLLDEIGRLKSLTAGADAAGARVHNLPVRPSDIEDDGEFHYAVLGPRAASDPSRPSAEARRYLDETTASDRPRVYRNAVVLAVPSRDGLEAARNAVRHYLGWQEVRSLLKDQQVDPIREKTLAGYLDAAKKRMPEVIRQAYCIGATVSENNEVECFRVTVGDEPLFGAIKAHPRARIQDAPVSADALLPGGPYDLWRGGETSRRVKDLVGAFAQLPHLPKMLGRQAILDTLVAGCVDGLFVLRLMLPDRSVKTFWRKTPDEASLRDPALEAVLPEAATLAEVDSTLLEPGVLPGLWESTEVAIQELFDYFSGGRTIHITREGYEDVLTIPKADRAAVEAAVRVAVKDGKLWLSSGPASIMAEEIPAGVLTDDALLKVPPVPIPALDILPERLVEAWEEDTTTGLAVAVALSKKAGKALPWPTVREAIDGALRAGLLERTLDSGPWPCDFSGANAVKLRLPRVHVPQPAPQAKPTAGVLVAEAEVGPMEIQDLAEQVGEITRAAVGFGLKFYLRVELGGHSQPSDETVSKISALLQRVSDGLRLR